jgi:sugar lactone lactonase YvrE
MATTRYGGASTDDISLADGWSLRELSRPSALVGANGLRFGPDGNLVIAQAYGSELTSLDLTAGTTTALARSGGDVVSPDDIAFDSRGTMFVTELTVGRVSAMDGEGAVRVLDADLPAANGIAVHEDRLFVGEYREGGRIFELFPDGNPRRLIADDLFWPNGMQVGPDGSLYFPSVLAGEIYRVSPDGGTPERVMADLALPSAIKVDEKGTIWAAEVGGDIVRVDPVAGRKQTFASLAGGLDNLAFGPDGDLYVSNLLDGRITELGVDGLSRDILPPGLVGPSGIDVGADGSVYCAEIWSYAEIAPDGSMSRPSNVMLPGFPGVVRSIAAAPDGTLRMSTTVGDVVAYSQEAGTEVLASGLGTVMSIAVRPGGGLFATDADAGTVVAIERSGEVATLASGLDRPTGVAVVDDATCVVAESGAGRLVRVDGDGKSVLAEGLRDPNGVAVTGGEVFAIDREARELRRVAANGTLETIARDLPVGGASGVSMRALNGFPPMAPGPWLPFSDLAVGPGGELYVGADGTGNVIVIGKDSALTNGGSR